MAENKDKKKSFAKTMFEGIIEEKPDAVKVAKAEVYKPISEKYGDNDLSTAVRKGAKELNATGSITSNEMKVKTENKRFNDAVRASNGDWDKAAEIYNRKYRHNLDASGEESLNAELYGTNPQRNDIRNGKDMKKYADERNSNKKSFTKRFWEGVK